MMRSLLCRGVAQRVEQQLQLTCSRAAARLSSHAPSCSAGPSGATGPRPLAVASRSPLWRQGSHRLCAPGHVRLLCAAAEEPPRGKLPSLKVKIGDQEAEISISTGADAPDDDKAEMLLEEEVDLEGLDDDDFEDASGSEDELEEEDYDPTFVTGGAPWGEKALEVARAVLAQPKYAGELEMYSFRAYPAGGRLIVRLDKLSDTYGSPGIEDLQSFNEDFSTALEAAGVAPDDLSMEVSSAGAEREIRFPKDLGRFEGLPMTVTYGSDGDSAAATKQEVMELVEWDLEGKSTTWKLADVKENKKGMKKGQGLNKKQRERREVLSFDQLQQVKMYLDL